MADLLSAIGTGVGTVLGGPVGGALVGGGLNLVGGLLQQQGQISSIQQQEQFQQGMSSSAYSRAVQDMKNAGLNPALMYGGGGPESTPSGASMTPPNVLGDAANSAFSASQIAAGVGQTGAQTDLVRLKQMTEKLDQSLLRLKNQITTYSAKAAPGAEAGDIGLAQLVQEHPWLQKLMAVGDLFHSAAKGATTAAEAVGNAAEAVPVAP